jgi:hypothetical protein
VSGFKSPVAIIALEDTHLELVLNFGTVKDLLFTPVSMKKRSYCPGTSAADGSGITPHHNIYMGIFASVTMLFVI